MDKRLNALETWIKQVNSVELLKIEPASADASFRRYFRAHIKPCEKFNYSDTLIVMDAPPEHEDNSVFVICAHVFEECGLHAPKIFTYDLDQGFLLIEDLGSLIYQDQLEKGDAGSLYVDACIALINLQINSKKHVDNFKPYDKNLLLSEMSLFEEWYIDRHLNAPLNNNQKYSLSNIFILLLNNAAEQPQVLVHRDYHCRNLLVTETNNPGIIDFQDMVVGPITYDLASLFKDCYISWPRHQVESWVENYRLEAVRSKLVDPKVTSSQWLKWFDLMGVQRHLKVLGIFARLSHRDHKSQYIKDLPLVNRYLIEACSYYSELQPLAALLHEIHSK